MKKPRHRPAPVSFTAEQVPDEETRRIMQEGFAKKKLPKTTE